MPLLSGAALTTWVGMEDDEYEFEDEVQCVRECNFVMRRERRPGEGGTFLVEDVEVCTACGRVLSREPAAVKAP